jgi:hypothetical protein
VTKRKANFREYLFHALTPQIKTLDPHAIMEE